MIVTGKGGTGKTSVAAALAQAAADEGRRALVVESDELNTQLILGYLTSTYWRHLRPERRLLLAGDLEKLLWLQTTSVDRPSLAAAYFGAYRSVALTPQALSHLTRIWRGDESVRN